MFQNLGKSILNSEGTEDRSSNIIQILILSVPRYPLQTHTNSPIKKSATQVELNAKDRKYGNLESNVVLGEDTNKEKLQYNPNLGRATFGTDATWTAQAGTAKIVNAVQEKVNTYKKRQEQLSSHVFGQQEDYSYHAPQSKKVADANNIYDAIKRGDHLFSEVLPLDTVAPAAQDGTPNSNGLKGSDLIHATRTWAEADVKRQLKNAIVTNTLGHKMNELRSTLDTHTFEPEIMKAPSVCGSTYNTQNVVACKTPSRATKIKDLSSNLLGQDAYSKYGGVRENASVVELVVSGLPSDAQAGDLRRIAGARHVVEAVVDQDTIKNVCTGTGKIRVRLGDGEDLDQFLQAGIDVRDGLSAANKRPTFTYQQSLLERSPQRQDIDPRATRAQNLQSSDPETFGNSSTFQNKFNQTYDPHQMSMSKKSTLIEKLAMQSWSRVNGTAKKEQAKKAVTKKK